MDRFDERKLTFLPEGCQENYKYSVIHSLSEVLQRVSMADSLAQLTARAEAAENAVDGLAR